MLSKTFLDPVHVLSRLHLDALTLTKSTFLAMGGLAAAWALTQTPQDWGAFALLAGLVVTTELFAVARPTSSGVVSFSFAAYTAAVFILGPGPAILLGVFGTMLGDGLLRLRRSAAFEKTSILALMLVAASWAGGALPSAPGSGEPLTYVIMAYWTLVFTGLTIHAVRARRSDNIALWGAMAALGWLILLWFQALWLPLIAQQITNLDATLISSVFAFTAAFMFVDNVATSSLELASQGLRGVRFWRYSLTPAFMQYNILALVSLATVFAFRSYGVEGLAAAAVVVGALAYTRHVMVKKEDLLVSTLCALASVLDAKDHYTEGHSHQVAVYSVALARALGLSIGKQKAIQVAAQLHDIGKIGIPDNVLLKPGRFTPEEYEVMKRHVPIGVDILWNVPELRGAARIVEQEHERWNGTGYPKGLKGASIKLEARIIAIADVYDALTSDRPYRTAEPPEQALAVLEGLAGTELDPSLVKAFVEVSRNEELETELAFAYCLTH